MARRIFTHIYMLRFPLLVLIFLGVILPLTLRTSMFRGFADLEMNQIVPVSLGVFLLLSSAMTCSFLVLLYGTDRADGTRRQPLAPVAGGTKAGASLRTLCHHKCDSFSRRLFDVKWPQELT
jgi:hypothetical protein